MTNIDTFVKQAGLVAETDARIAGDEGLSARLDPIAPVLVPSYANLGATGDRRGIISAFCTNARAAASAHQLLDGDGATRWSFLAGNALGTEIRFGFPSAVVVDEMLFSVNGTASHGIWQMQGSNDADTWTNIGATFELIGVAGSCRVTSLNANKTQYLFYRLSGVSGTTQPSAQGFFEVDFRIAGLVPSAAPVDPVTPIGSKLLWPDGTDAPAGWRYTKDRVGDDVKIVRVLDPKTLMRRGDFWWDASDPETITKDGSNRVSKLADKSGNGVHLLQSDDAKKPLSTGAILTRPALDTRGGKTMRPILPLYLNTAAETFFVYMAPDKDTRFIVHTGAGQRWVWSVGFSAGPSRTMGVSSRHDAQSMVQNTILPTWDVTAVPTITANKITETFTANSFAQQVSEVTMFSQIDGVSQPLDGMFGEGLVFNRALDDVTRAQIVTYLSQRWQGMDETVRKWHAVLLTGQSNMTGRDFYPDIVLDAGNPRIASLVRLGVDADTLRTAEHPLEHRDNSTGSSPLVGPGLAYAKALLATLPASEGIVLVPCARGSTSSDYWDTDTAGILTEAIDRMNLTLTKRQTVVPHSILHLQGESDAGGVGTNWAPNTDSIIAKLRAGISGGATLPVVLGQIDRNLDSGGYPSRDLVNAAILDTPNRVSRAAVATSESLTTFDGVHYDVASARTIGERMAAAYATIT